MSDPASGYEKFLEAKRRRDDAERTQKQLDAHFENVRTDFVAICAKTLYELKFERAVWESANQSKKAEIQNWINELSKEFDLDLIYLTLGEMSAAQRKPKLCKRIAEYLEIKPL